MNRKGVHVPMELVHCYHVVSEEKGGICKGGMRIETEDSWCVYPPPPN